MPENEFEKKVAAELGGLKFNPSGEVWLKVEARIRKKKKRRIIILIFLFAGFLLLGYWQRDNLFDGSKEGIVKNENQTMGKNNSPEQKESNENKPDDLIKEKQIIDADRKNSYSDQEELTVTDFSTRKTGTNSPTNSSEQIIVSKKQNDFLVYNNRIDPNYKKKSSIPGQKPENISTRNDVKVFDAANETTVASNPNKSVEVTIEDNSLTKTQTQTVNKSDAVNQPDVNSQNLAYEKQFPRMDSVVRKDSISRIDSVIKVISIDSPVVHLQKRSIDKKWKLGIEFTPGISSFHESFLSFNITNSADAYANPNSSSGGGLTTASPVAGQSGFGLHFGGFAEKQISKRSSLNVGLRYSYYSEKLSIGNMQTALSTSLRQYLNSAGANLAYGAGGSNTSFTNKYHFIELPVMYKLRLNKDDKHPLSAALGFKIGRMLTSSAILYDTTAGGIYYNNKNLFNKTQFGLSAGFDWTIINSGKIRFSAGPSLDLHMTSLYDNPFDSKKYVYFLGLRTSILLDKKK